ncbi:Polyadenylate-binding protein RBP45B [Striga hermonthica]|uniref:Polyadenylate-binding protein RBP45B n=1 Tax=Striga hermonthica TaxID=68872 RepID=A0A9N7RB91_STRHE|nr:Polyadenylate-binding protein RBP45B [Striga hermonthica]
MMANHRRRLGEFLLSEPIIHRIQSFLSGKEAARTTVLSKSWRKAWLTRPSLDFGIYDFTFADELSRFMDKTIQRYEESNLKIESLTLTMALAVCVTLSLPNLRNLRHLELRHMRIYTSFFGDLSCKFPLLRDLSMVHCAYQGDLLISSPTIEYLNIEYLRFETNCIEKTVSVEFDVPSIRKFKFTSSNKLLTDLRCYKIHLSMKVGHTQCFSNDEWEFNGLTLHQVEQLTVDGMYCNTLSLTCSALFDGLFRLCCPKFITQPNHTPNYPSDFLFKTFLRLNYECSGRILGGLRHLEKVRAQIFDEDGHTWRLIPLDTWDVLKDQKEICFQLMWRDERQQPGGMDPPPMGMDHRQQQPPQQQPYPPQQHQPAQAQPPSFWPQQHYGATPANAASSGQAGGGTDEVRSLWVGDLQYWMDENYLSNCFYNSGEFVSAKVIRNKQTGQSEGYGFLEFRTRAAGENILQTYNGTTMPNSKQPFRMNWASLGAGDKRSDGGPEHTIFVGDLAGEVTDYILQETFRAVYQSVRGAKVVTDRNTGRSKGYGFVKFGDEREQQRAMNEMNGVPEKMPKLPKGLSEAETHAPDQPQSRPSPLQ